MKKIIILILSALLILSLSGCAKRKRNTEILTTTEAVMEAEPTLEPIKPTEEAVPQKRGHRARRGELLRALKPYVSSERSKAIESMISITEILDMMRES